uniref:ATP synthase complex subunit 8 n=1 Tax=Waoraniella jarlinsoni TaxID=2597004 RepID=A0A8K2AU26_9NEOP|nr:ATP synthase F0 subunit 8 [Waoraniella jarlinsoni]
MPQMNPMWWLSLFMMFTMIFLTTNSLNYFYKNHSIKFELKKNKKNLMNWKW